MRSLTISIAWVACVIEMPVPRSTSQAPPTSSIAIDALIIEGRNEGNHHAALQLDLVGDHVGGNDRLAVARAGGMEDAIGEGQADQRSRCHGSSRIAFKAPVSAR